MCHAPAEAGKSSFDLIEDPEVLFETLPLNSARVVLDLGCGEGRYALPLARRVDPGSVVRGFDLWEEGIARLGRAAAEAGLDNVTGEVADLSDLAQVPDASADLALLATVVHDLMARDTGQAALAEAHRVLKPVGILAVVEFRKVESDPGPPRRIRLAPEELTAAVSQAGFRHPRLVDLGPVLYLALYEKQR